MKAIYKLTAIVVILFTTFTGSAQSRSYRIFDEFAHKDGFINLAFSKAMIDVVDLKIDEENKKITGDLMEIRILISDREKNKIEGSLSKIISGKFQKMDYKKVEPKNEAENDNIELWIDGDSKRVRECHVIVMNSEDDQFSCLVSFYGNFKVEDLKSFEKFSRKQANKQ
jgi:hypothetical protein